MSLTLAFDVYGTLINTHGLVLELETWVESNALEFSKLWREKQLEYTFRRGLMSQYKPFSICTSDALRYACKVYGVEPGESQIQGLLQKYSELPPFDDVLPGLTALQSKDVNLFAFSNGTANAVDHLLNHAGIGAFFQQIISVDDIKTFKPNPLVYQHFLTQTQSNAQQAWLISSNPFDIIGAKSCGMHAVWVKRSEGVVFDVWELEPDKIVGSIDELANALPI